MRTGFRILVLDKTLDKIDNMEGFDKNLSRAIKCIHKSQYLEASKWLFLAHDSKEKYLLLYLINLALKQKEEASAFLNTSREFSYLYKDVFDIYIQKPGEDIELVSGT
jgi:hypothetical protein